MTFSGGAQRGTAGTGIFPWKAELKQSLWAPNLTSLRWQSHHHPCTASSSPGWGDRNRSLCPSWRLCQLVIPGGSNRWCHHRAGIGKSGLALLGYKRQSGTKSGPDRVEQRLGVVLPCLRSILQRNGLFLPNFAELSSFQDVADVLNFF